MVDSLPLRCIVVVTDRVGATSDVQCACETLGRCVIMGLHDKPPHTAFCLIVCDVAFDDLGHIDLLRAALGALGGASVPIVCLLRDPGHLGAAYARSIGASAAIPRNTATHDLAEVGRSLISGRGVWQDGRNIHDDVKEAEQSLSSMFEAAGHGRPISLEALDRGGKAVLAATKQARIRTWLEIVRRYDNATYQHCLLVAGLAAAFAVHLGLTKTHQRLLTRAALVHDIGKARIPLSILNKPGKLTASEMTVMKMHPALGHNMLIQQSGFDRQLTDIVRHHHEHLDGSGYPDGMRGDQISDFVRMTTICDIYAALIERRPYKAPMPRRQALSVLVEMGGKLDAALVRAFEAVTKEA